MKEVQQKINEILLEKQTKILPENIKKGVNILGVDGTAKVPTPIYATTDYTIKSVNSSIAGESVNNISVKGNYCLVSNYAKDSVELYKITDSSLVYVDTFMLDYSGGRACIVDVVDNLIYIIRVKNRNIMLHSYNIDTGETYNVRGSNARHNCNIVMNYYNTDYFIVYDSGDTSDVGYIYKLNDNKTGYTQVTTTPTENINFSNYSLSRPLAPNLFIAWSVNSNAYMYLSKCTIETGNWNTQSIEIDVVGKIIGASYDGTKVFILDKGIYALNSDLSIGEKLADLTIDIPSNHFLSAINDKYYILTNYSNINTGTNNVFCDLYEFNNETNTFTYINSLQDVVFHPGHIASLSADTSLVDIYDFISSDTQIGMSFDGKNYYYSNSNSVTSDKVISGYEVYTKGYQPMIGTMPNNGDVVIEPTTSEQVKEKGYYKSLKINPVTSAIDPNIIPENIKQGVNILGVDGTLVESNIKQFKTTEEMNQSTENQKGTIAMVIDKVVKDLTAGETVRYVAFPQEVTLDSAVTDSYTGMLKYVDSAIKYTGTITLSATEFSYEIWYSYPDDILKVSYTSTDGITYTRTTDISDMYDLCGLMYADDSNSARPWNASFGKFIKNTYYDFKGVYEFDGESWILAKTQLYGDKNATYKYSYYGIDGIQEGNIGNNSTVSNIDAEIYTKILNKYSESEQIVLTDSNKTIDTSIKVIPITWDCKPLYDTSQLTSFSSLFTNCQQLLAIPKLDTTNCTKMLETFNNCYKLEYIPVLDISKVTTLFRAFYNCNSLNDKALENILTMLLQIPDYTDKTLMNIGLSETLANKCTTLSNWASVQELGWTTGY